MLFTQSTKKPHKSSAFKRWKHSAAWLASTNSPAVNLPWGLQCNHIYTSTKHFWIQAEQGQQKLLQDKTLRYSQDYLMPPFQHLCFSSVFHNRWIKQMQARGTHKWTTWKHQHLRFLSSEKRILYELTLAKFIKKECYLLYWYPSWSPNFCKDISRDKWIGVLNAKHGEDNCTRHNNGAYEGQNVRKGQKSDRFKAEKSAALQRDDFLTQVLITTLLFQYDRAIAEQVSHPSIIFKWSNFILE